MFTLYEEKGSAYSHQTVANGIENETGGVVNVQLFEDVVAVCIDRANAEVQESGDFVVGFSFGDKLQNLLFALGKE
jgi:hypothetical protein